MPSKVEWIARSGDQDRGTFAGGCVWYPEGSACYVYYTPVYRRPTNRQRLAKRMRVDHLWGKETPSARTEAGRANGLLKPAATNRAFFMAQS